MASKKKAVKKSNGSKALEPVQQKDIALILEDADLFAVPKRLAEIASEPTPPEHIEKVQGYDYVRIGWMRRKLNEMFGMAWSTEATLVKDDGKGVVVKVKLTVVHPKTGQLLLTREQFGGQTYRNNVPYENTFKAACSDGLKKCASTLGICQDVYEPKVEKNIDKQERREARAVEQIKDKFPGAKVVNAEVVKDGEPEFGPGLPNVSGKSYAGKPDDERISIHEVSNIARLLDRNPDIRKSMKEFMKKNFGTGITSNLNWGQYRQLLDHVKKLDPENPPF